MKLFRPKFDEIPTIDPHEEMKDGVLTKDVSPTGNAYEYVKTVSISGTRYFITFTHNPADNGENELSLHFGLIGIDGDPITNAGLETFGRIVDEMTNTYEEILKQEPVDHILITASWDGYSKDDIEKVRETIAEDPRKLNGFEIIQEGYQPYSIKFEDGVAIVKTKGKLKVPFTDRIPVTASLLEDLKHITKVDIADFIPDILNYVKGAMTENKKQVQRLKLYQFYLHKRYPQFTFNSKEIVLPSGKKDIEFEKYEDGHPYLLVTTNSQPGV